MADAVDVKQLMAELAQSDESETMPDTRRFTLFMKEIKRRVDAGEYLAKDQLRHGHYYHGSCRNSTIARWNSETQRFVYWRCKFGYLFAEDICHPVDEDHFDVFYAFEETRPCLYTIPLEGTPIELKMT